MAFRFLPPSPALSACDSLAGIDDLDAFLAAQGPLSVFPTPDPRDEVLSNRRACYTAPRTERISSLVTPELESITECVQSIRGDDVSYFSIAELFARKAHPSGACTAKDNTAVADLLERADLPIELLALAYAILDQLSERTSQRLETIGCETGLLITAALALADIHINDHPRHLATWARLITTRTISVHCLDRTMLGILDSLNWTIHSLCDPAVVSTYQELLTQRHKTFHRLQTRDASTACWLFGQLTPAEQSPCPVVRQPATTACFLPLL